MSPKVSIIIPNYNYAHFLKERIHSVSEQTFKDFEIIILDDASTDNSREIIEQYRVHPKVSQIIYNDTNSRSPFSQWLKGINVAKGEYIWIAEADDSAEPTFLESILESFLLYPSAVMAGTGSIFIDENNNEISENHAKSTLIKDFDNWEEDHKKIFYSGIEYLDKFMSHTNPCYNASKMVFKKEAFTKAPIDLNLLIKMRYEGDYYFWSCMMACGGIVEIHSKLNKFRFQSSSVTHTGRSCINPFKERLLFKESLFNSKWFPNYLKDKDKYILYKSVKRRFGNDNTLYNEANAAFNKIFPLSKSEKSFLWLNKHILHNPRRLLKKLSMKNATLIT